MARKWWTLIAVCTATFMLLLDITIVNVALPAIQRSLDATFSDLQWVVDAYALALATCVLTAGSLADLFGRKRVFLIGVALFTLASAACGAANDPLFLIIARGVQGLGGAMMFATALALLSQEFHGKERGTAFGVWGATIGAAVAIGPLAGGILTSWLSWRWIFLVNIPIGIAAIILSAKQLHESSDPEHSRLDPLGLVTLIGGLFCLILALIEGNKQGWSTSWIIGLFVAAAVLLVVFILSQRGDRTTMVDLALFKRPAFVGAQTTAFAISSSMFAMFLYLTLFLQNILGLSPLKTGLVFLPLSVVSFVAAPIAGRLSTRVPIRILLAAGLALNAIAMWSMSRVTVFVGLDGPAPGLPDRRRRHRPRECAACIDRRLDRPAGTRRDGLRHQQHLPPARDRNRDRGAGRDLRKQGRPARVRAAPGHRRARLVRRRAARHPSIGAVVAACGAVLAAALVRPQDFVASGPQRPRS